MMNSYKSLRLLTNSNRELNSLALLGGQPVRASPLPGWPVATEEDVRAVSAVLSTNRLTLASSGAVRQFEDDLAAYHKLKHAVTCSSGTSAMYLLLSALGLGQQDEVICPTYTFVGSVGPLLHLGGIPVLCDIDELSQCIDARSLRVALSSDTRAVIAVHLNGQPLDIDSLRALIPPNVFLIEDCAQALGAKISGSPVGSAGDASVLSFFESKIVTTLGEGGAVLTNDSRLAERIRILRNHGTITSGRHSLHISPGHNFRMSAAGAAMGDEQLRRLDAMVERQRSNAGRLTALLIDVPGLRRPTETAGTRSTFWRYVCRLDVERFVMDIDGIVDALMAEGIPAARRYPTPLHLQPLFTKSNSRALPCPAAERAARDSLTLPVHPSLSDNDVSDVATAVRKVFKALYVPDSSK